MTVTQWQARCVISWPWTVLKAWRSQIVCGVRPSACGLLDVVCFGVRVTKLAWVSATRNRRTSKNPVQVFNGILFRMQGWRALNLNPSKDLRMQKGPGSCGVLSVWGMALRLVTLWKDGQTLAWGGRPGEGGEDCCFGLSNLLQGHPLNLESPMLPLWHLFCSGLSIWAWKQLAGKDHSPEPYYLVGKFRWLFAQDSVALNCCFSFLGELLTLPFLLRNVKLVTAIKQFY